MHKRNLQYYLLDLSGLHFLNDKNVSIDIILMYVIRQSSKRLSPILFLNFLFL
jgi:hypothetical protein